MTIDHIQVIVMSSGPPMTRQLQRWLADNCLEWRYGSAEYGLDLARQQNTVDFLRNDVPRGKLFLLGVDHDTVPIRETRHILRGDDDLVYCGYCGRHGSRGHIGDGDFGAGCFRVSANLLQRMGSEWWRTTVVDGRRMECECQWFRKRAEKCGATSKMVGLIGHEQRCILIPSQDAPSYAVVWPEELEAKQK